MRNQREPVERGRVKVTVNEQTVVVAYECEGDDPDCLKDALVDECKPHFRVSP